MNKTSKTTLSVGQEADLRRLKQKFPNWFCFVAVHSKTGDFQGLASPTRPTRLMRAFKQQGYTIFT